MILPFCKYSTPFSRKIPLAAFCLTVVAITATGRAVTISALIETPTSLSFNFSGSGIGDFAALGPSLSSIATFWFTDDEPEPVEATGTFGATINVGHSPTGPFVTLGSITSLVPFGTTLSDSETIAHGAGADAYTFSITVQNNGNNQWGAFAGSFSAVHGAAGVSDQGTTVVLLGSVLLGLATLRRRLLTA